MYYVTAFRLSPHFKGRTPTNCVLVLLVKIQDLQINSTILLKPVEIRVASSFFISNETRIPSPDSSGILLFFFFRKIKDIVPKLGELDKAPNKTRQNFVP